MFNKTPCPLAIERVLMRRDLVLLPVVLDLRLWVHEPTFLGPGRQVFAPELDGALLRLPRRLVRVLAALLDETGRQVLVECVPERLVG